MFDKYKQICECGAPGYNNIPSHLSHKSGNCHIGNVTNCMPTLSFLLLVQLLN